MKKWFGRILPVVIIIIVVAAAVLMGTAYFDFVSEGIYEDSTAHLEEIYGQVNRTFSAFIEQNWGVLRGWEDSLAMYEKSGDYAGAAARIAEEKEYWGFSGFYLLSADMEYMTPDGTSGTVEPGSSWDELMSGREPIMTGKRLTSGRDATVFAVPTQHGEYNGFGYDAIAVSYTNEDIVSSLNVDAFDGNAKCFVIHSDGSVLLSTQSGGGVFGNYLVYLGAASDLDAEALQSIEEDWLAGRANLLRCKVGDVSNCILYQPVGYKDFILLSVVPESVLSAGFLSVQRATMNFLLAIFGMIVVCLVCVFLLRSRSQSRRSRTELQYREKMFDVLSNNVDDIFIMLDGKRHSVDYISPNLERLLGVGVDKAREDVRVLEKCAVNFNVVIPGDELAKMPLNGTRSWECEYVHQTTGERRWYRMTLYHMDIQNVGKYIIVMSDRTREQQMNQKMQEALNAARSANEAKSNFLSNMSHDIRTPMNAIVGFSVLLENNADEPEKVREYTRKITASSRHLLSLINDVLDMSKIESGKTSLNLDVFSLPDLLEELNIILNPQAKAKGQSFTIHLQGTPPEHMLGDKLRLNQILINLLSNAVKYTQTGGKIEFVVCELPQPAPQYAKLRFVVRDNGIGMSEEFQKHIFAPFSREINSVTNKIQGTGLGMAITKNLVDLMGGIINVESTPGEGSTFTVELSFALPEADETENWYSRKVTRLLAADDEEDICRSIGDMMRGTGVAVDAVTSGEEAVRLASEAHGRGEGYDVILLDWKMPGMDGVETARRIRESVGTDVPILVLTSYDWSEIESEAREAGINAFMPKPFFTSTFWQTIRPLFREDEAPKEPEEEKRERVMEGLLFLVAEDNELNAEILTEMLDMEGARCELAVNGLEAAEMFEASAPGYYDMVLMDVQMPVMNGYDATRRIRASGHPDAKRIPIAAMTANTFAEDVRDALEVGMDGHLAKPIDMDAVRSMVSSMSSRFGHRDGGGK